MVGAIHAPSIGQIHQEIVSIRLVYFKQYNGVKIICTKLSQKFWNILVT